MAIDFPSNPTTGQTYNGFTFDGAAWSSIPGTLTGIPAGSIIAWGNATPPVNWLICDGSAISRSTYASLFSAIGTTYGVGDGSTTFNVPDLRGRVPVGKNSATFATLGATGGAETVTLDITQIPSHTHAQDSHTHTFSGTTSTTGSHNHINGWASITGYNYVGSGGNSTWPFGGGSNAAQRDLQAAGDHAHTYSGTTSTQSVATNQNTGGGLAHNNLQPYQVVSYIIKYSAAVTAGDSELATRVGAIETTTVRSVALGGTGASTLTGYAKGSGTSALSGVTTIPVADGGTGSTTASGALTNLGAAAASHTHAASAITSGQLDVARLPSGTVIQAVTGTTTTQVSAAGGWFDTGCNVSIQPKFATSRFIIIATPSSYSTRGSGTDTGFSLRVVRNISGADTAILTDPSSYLSSYVYGGSSAVIIAKPTMHVNDYTGVITAANYRVQCLTYASGTTYFQYAGTPSSITILEVAP